MNGDRQATARSSAEEAAMATFRLECVRLRSEQLHALATEAGLEIPAALQEKPEAEADEASSLPAKGTPLVFRSCAPEQTHHVRVMMHDMSPEYRPWPPIEAQLPVCQPSHPRVHRSRPWAKYFLACLLGR
jgi:hypothetical protein